MSEPFLSCLACSDGTVTFERVLTRNYTLQDGFTIPKGTQIGFPTQALSMDEDTVSNPEQFDAYRNLRLREENPSDAAKAQWSASNLKAMSFGKAFYLLLCLR